MDFSDKKLEEFWQSIESELEDPDDFLDTALLILEILKTQDPLDFDSFYDEYGDVKSYHELCKLKRLSFSFDSNLSTSQLIHDLLQSAIREGKAEYVAQHLVGAKLQLRFPELEIENNAASTADKPQGRQGDFFVGDTAFHVTVAPMRQLFEEKCLANIAEGFKAYVIVPAEKLNLARALEEAFCNGHIAVESLESFVSQNIEEISVFAADQLKHNLVSLINIYNERVNAIEVDKSLMIELPSNLEKYNG